MECRNLLVMIAAVAAWSIVSGANAGDSASSKAKPPELAARIRALIQRDSKNAEIVTFDDRRLAPVKIVRGAEKHPRGPAAHGSVSVVSFPGGNNMSPVRILRGGNLIAATSAIPGPGSMRPADTGSSETVNFTDPRELPVTVLRGPTASWAGNTRFAAATNATFELFPAARAAISTASPLPSTAPNRATA